MQTKYLGENELRFQIMTILETNNDIMYYCKIYIHFILKFCLEDTMMCKNCQFDFYFF